MKNNSFHQLFIDELEDMHNAEKQIVESLPNLIKAASLPDVKEALTKHLKETKNQVVRLEKIFSFFKLPPKEKKCKAMKGLLEEASDLINNKPKSPILDAAIISACQKVEHYEIASYGTLISFAKHLDLAYEITDLLKENLEEEGKADKTLTNIAEGSFFSSGVNKEAAAEKQYVNN